MQKVAIVLPTYLEKAQPLIFERRVDVMIFVSLDLPGGDLMRLSVFYSSTNDGYVGRTHMAGNGQDVSLGHFWFGHCDGSWVKWRMDQCQWFIQISYYLY